MSRDSVYQIFSVVYIFVLLIDKALHAKDGLEFNYSELKFKSYDYSDVNRK